ncbi:hypothetical protein BPOR_1117g00030 [Botrytis porri]|uniref:Uncharacterized protein n=1 Tax=Botrytis porri TaxID=87229 RepID=A0A4Z1K5W2_9HELO|nr:hypothetical protein BPOR_1117g00030 [Botrytis porri]
MTVGQALGFSTPSAIFMSAVQPLNNHKIATMGRPSRKVTSTHGLWSMIDTMPVPSLRQLGKLGKANTGQKGLGLITLGVPRFRENSSSHNCTAALNVGVHVLGFFSSSLSCTTTTGLALPDCFYSYY